MQNSAKPIIIAVDGTAAGGKGTISRMIADTYNLAYLDTGKLYRAVGLYGLDAKDDWDLNNPRLKDDDIAQKASEVAADPAVRDALKQYQIDFAHTPPPGKNGTILDGRDIGTVICPDADVKLFITADTDIRAQRRYKELQSLNSSATYEAVLKDMRARDARDQGRKTAPLVPADDAVIIDTGHLAIDEVFRRATDIIAARVSL